MLKPKFLYLTLSVIGFVVPYCHFAPWLAEHGMNWRLFVDHLLANRVSSFFGIDVGISAIVLTIWVLQDRKRFGPMWWVPLAGVVTIGVSLGLPLCLYLRERQKEELYAVD